MMEIGRQMRALAAGAVALSVGLALAGAADAASGSAKTGLFGDLEFASEQLDALPLWRDALKRTTEQRGAIERCEAEVGNCASTALTVWRAKVQELRTREPLARLLEANKFVNRFRQRSDRDAFGRADYWAAPLEFLDQGGDAEDFAIMKFITLRDTGIANDDLRLVIVYDALRDRRHAVLTARVGRKTYLLDTLSDAVLPVDRHRYYVPFYSVNETTRWAHVARPPKGG